MPVTRKDIQDLQHVYLKKYNKRLSDREAADIITRLVNLLLIIYDYE